MLYSLLLLLPFLPTIVLSDSHTNQTWDGGDVATTKKVMSAVIDNSNVELKKTFRELKNYALLKNDSKGSLSKEFTMCSTIFTSKDFIHFLPILLFPRVRHWLLGVITISSLIEKPLLITTSDHDRARPHSHTKEAAKTQT